MSIPSELYYPEIKLALLVVGAVNIYLRCTTTQPIGSNQVAS